MKATNECPFAKKLAAKSARLRFKPLRPNSEELGPVSSGVEREWHPQAAGGPFPIVRLEFRQLSRDAERRTTASQQRRSAPRCDSTIPRTLEASRSLY